MVDARRVIINNGLVDSPMQKLMEVDCRYDHHMFESIDDSISIGDVYSIGESFLLILILIQLVLYINPIIAVLTNGIILQSGGMAKPLVDLIEIGKIVRIFFVDLVEVCLAG